MELPSSTHHIYGVIVLERSSKETPFPLTQPVVQVGRLPHCAVRIYDRKVSSLHCEIVTQPVPRLVVHSVNGVLSQGIVVQRGESMPLLDGSRFTIAGRTFRWQSKTEAQNLVAIQTPAKTSGSPKHRKIRFSLVNAAQIDTPDPGSPKQRPSLITSLPLPFALFSKSLSPSPAVPAQEDLISWSDDEQDAQARNGDQVTFDQMEPPSDSSDSEESDSDAHQASPLSRRKSLRMTISASPAQAPRPSQDDGGETSDEEVERDLLVSPTTAAAVPLPEPNSSEDESPSSDSDSDDEPSSAHTPSRSSFNRPPLHHTPTAPGRLPASLSRKHSLRERVLIKSAVRAHHDRGKRMSRSLSMGSQPLSASPLQGRRGAAPLFRGQDDADVDQEQETHLANQDDLSEPGAATDNVHTEATSSSEFHFAANSTTQPDDDISEFFVSSESSSDDEDDDALQQYPADEPEQDLDEPAQELGQTNEPEPLVFGCPRSSSHTPRSTDLIVPTKTSDADNVFLDQSRPSLPHSPSFISPRAARAARRSSGISASPSVKSPPRRRSISASEEAAGLEEVRGELKQHEPALETTPLSVCALPVKESLPAPSTLTPAKASWPSNAEAIKSTPLPPVPPETPSSHHRLSPRKSALKLHPPLGADGLVDPPSPTLRKRKSVVFGEPEYKTIANRDDPEFLAEQESMRILPKRRRISPRLSAEQQKAEEAPEADRTKTPTKEEREPVEMTTPPPQPVLIVRSLSAPDMQTPTKSPSLRAGRTPRTTPGKARRVPTATPPAAVAAAYEQIHATDERSHPLPGPRRSISPTKGSNPFLGTTSKLELAHLLASPAPKLNSDVFKTPIRNARAQVSPVKTPADMRLESLKLQLESAKKGNSSLTPSLAKISLSPESFGLRKADEPVRSTPPDAPTAAQAPNPPSSSFTPFLGGLKHLLHLPSSPPKTPAALNTLRTLFKTDKEPKEWDQHLDQGIDMAPEAPTAATAIPAPKHRVAGREEAAPSTTAVPRRATRSTRAVATDPAPRRTAASLRSSQASKVPLAPQRARTNSNSPTELDPPRRVTRSKASNEHLSAAAVKPPLRRTAKSMADQEALGAQPVRRVGSRATSGTTGGKENSAGAANSTGGRLTRTRALRSNA